MRLHKTALTIIACTYLPTHNRANAISYTVYSTSWYVSLEQSSARDLSWRSPIPTGRSFRPVGVHLMRRAWLLTTASSWPGDDPCIPGAVHQSASAVTTMTSI